MFSKEESFHLGGKVNRHNVGYVPTLGGIVPRAGSDGSMSASHSAGPGFDSWRGSKFSFENFLSRARRGGDLHFLIARLYITVLD